MFEHIILLMALLAAFVVLGIAAFVLDAFRNWRGGRK